MFGIRVSWFDWSKTTVLTSLSPLVVKATETEVVPKSIAAMLPFVVRYPDIDRVTLVALASGSFGVA